MQKKSRKIQSIFLTLMLVCLVFLPGIQTVASNENDSNEAVEITLTQNTDESTTISYDINEYTSEIEMVDGTEYLRYRIPDESNSKKLGFPDLPNVRRSIIIPNDKKMDVQIIDKEYTLIDNVDIIPSKGILPRTINPETVDYTFDGIYNKDIWYPSRFAELDDPYILRDFRGQVVQINPIQYNPVTHQIRKLSQIEIKVVSSGPGEINVLENTNFDNTIDVDFDKIYSHQFLNYQQTISNSKYTPVSEKGNMLVITYGDFYDEMVPFVEWKNMKGIPTEMVNLSDIGSTATDIDSYIENYYNTNGLTFVLLVGDIDQIPSITWSGHASDPSYSYIVGDDNYQDLFVGRFSANDVTELQTQIDRSIDYEKYPQTSADWYHKGLGVASDQGTGDDGEYDDEHMDIIRDQLLNFTYTEVEQSYDPDGTTQTIANALNAGTSITNYCGHGSITSWGNGGGFSNSDVNALVNDNMLPYIVSVACNTGEFESADACFCEAWMRATNDANGEATGAIGIFGSTQSQSWSPPMDAQDEINDLFCAEENFALGALSFLGTMHMMDEYGSSCYDETNTWTYFGDPSTQLRTDTPESMTVDHDSSLMSGSMEFEVTVTGVEDALCAISHNGQLLGYDYTDAAGESLITFDEPITDMDEVDLIITAFNKDTYITTLEVLPPLRNIPEFAPMQGVLIRYPFGINYDIIAEMSENVIVTTIVASASEQSTVESEYAANGVNTANCEYLIAPSDSYWTRDYGPWYRYNVTIDEIEVIDFEYNRPRPNDNEIPNEVANMYGLNSVYMDIVHAGGNYMTDGLGISASTDLVLSENSDMTEEEIQTMFMNYLGIQTYHIYPDPLGEYIEHIDCWGKFLSPDTIMILEVPESDSQHDDLDAAASYFENETSSYGTPYEVVRVYSPNDQPYTNSLILNDKVLVPITGSEWDDDAIASYESAMPGYEVLGFTNAGEDPWENTDALHCRAKGIPDLDMIHITHDELINQMPNDAGFKVEADILAYGAGNSVSSPQLHWRNSTDNVWNAESMTAEEDTYTAFIPNHPCGEMISYYISAENANGDVFKNPFIGTDDPFSFMVTLVPDIWIDPSSITLYGNEGEILTDILTVGNDDFAGEALNLTLTTTNTDGFGWLSVDITNASIMPGNELNVTVSADTANLSIDTYNEEIIINSNDPDTPMLTIPITLEVVYGDNVGAISVNYPTGAIPDGSYIINATIQNFGSNNQTNVPVNCTIFEGGIGGTILDEDFSSNPTDWMITHEDGTAWTWDSSDQRMENSYSGYPNIGTLDSPVLDCSGKQGIALSFWHHWKADYTSGDQDGWVRGSVDGGNTFPYLIDEFHHNDPPQETAVKTYDLPWADNQENVVIRFDVANHNDWYWYVDDVNLTADITGPLVYYSEETVDVNAYESTDIEFSPMWNAIDGVYGIQVSTLLGTDENPVNDHTAEVVFIEGPALSFDPVEYNAGMIMVNETDTTSFDIWNSGLGTLSYTLTESCDWLDLSLYSGDSTGENDTITLDIDTSGLDAGSYHCDVNISSNGGTGIFSVDMAVITSDTPLEDVSQSVFDRGFPIRHAVDGDWAGAQNFTPTMSSIAKVDLYLRSFGTPEFDLVVELREDDPEGTLLDSVTFSPSEVSSSWEWFSVDFADTPVVSGTDYFIVIPPAPSGISSSFGYEWGYALDDVYDGGSFWFTRDGGVLWRDLPDSYEFTFATHGLI